MYEPFVQPGNRNYVVVGAARSSSIAVSAEDSNSNDVTVEASAVQNAVSVEGKIAVTREGELISCATNLNLRTTAGRY